MAIVHMAKYCRGQSYRGTDLWKSVGDTFYVHSRELIGTFMRTNDHPRRIEETVADTNSELGLLPISTTQACDIG